MTLKAFQEAPALMTRARVKEVTGLSDSDIQALVESGDLRVWRRPGGAMTNDKAQMTKRSGPRGATGPTKSSEKAGQRRGPYGRYYTVEVARLCGFDLLKG